MNEGAPAPDAGAGSGAPGAVSTGVATLFGVLNGIAFSVLLGLQPVDAAALTLVLGLAAAIVSDGLPRVRSGPKLGFHPSSKRVAVKMLSLSAIIAFATVAYSAIPVFTFDDVFFGALARYAWLIVPLVLGYLFLSDGLDANPEDGCHRFGLVLLGRPASDPAAIRLFLRSWLVKMFFLPMMFSFLVHDFEWLREQPRLSQAFAQGNGIDYLVSLLFMVDVGIALVGYVATFRIFGWHVRDVEQTLRGWLACVVCYPPFNSAVLGVFLPFGGAGLTWSDLVDPGSLLGIAVGGLIILLQVVYVAATVSLGPRFSNLTHRGIVTSGAYRYCKHPAYLAKNLLWWLQYMPFVPVRGGVDAARRCLFLICINLIYLARAKSEERLLGRDPDYAVYKDRVNRNGAVATLCSTLRLRRRLGDRAKDADL